MLQMQLFGFLLIQERLQCASERNGQASRHARDVDKPPAAQLSEPARFTARTKNQNERGHAVSWYVQSAMQLCVSLRVLVFGCVPKRLSQNECHSEIPDGKLPLGHVWDSIRGDRRARR